MKENIKDKVMIITGASSGFEGGGRSWYGVQRY